MGMKVRSMSVVAVALGALLLSGCGDRLDASVGIPIQASGITALTCHFKKRSSTVLKNPDLSSVWGVLGAAIDAVPKIGSDPLTFTFTNLNWSGLTAKMVGNSGSVTAELIYEAGNLAPQIIKTERSISGNHTITSIFLDIASEKDIELSGFRKNDENSVLIDYIIDKQSFAAHSRHISFGNSAVVSQYTGVCDIAT